MTDHRQKKTRHEWQIFSLFILTQYLFYLNTVVFYYFIYDRPQTEEHTPCLRDDGCYYFARTYLFVYLFLNIAGPVTMLFWTPCSAFPSAAPPARRSPQSSTYG
jgi:hypothetical protein